MNKDKEKKAAEENVANENGGNSTNSNSASNTNANNTNSRGSGGANASNANKGNSGNGSIGNTNNIDTEKKDKNDNFFDVKLSTLLEHIRDFREVEISNQWQRSVMLGVFIVLVWTGIFSILGKDFCAKGLSSIEPLCYWILLGLSIVGFVFSILWIYMAKGSKYWYEYYEGRMKTLNKYLCYSLKESQKKFPKDAFKVMDKPCTKCSNCENISTKNKERLFELQDMLYGVERKSAEERFNLFSKKGQRCSLATINYLVGYINFILFITLSSIFVFFLAKECILFFRLLAVGGVLLFLSFIVCCINCKLKSNQS